MPYPLALLHDNPERSGSTSLRNEMGSFRGEKDARFDAVDVRFNQVNDRLARVESGVFGNEPPVPPETPPGNDAIPDPVADL